MFLSLVGVASGKSSEDQFSQNGLAMILTNRRAKANHTPLGIISPCISTYLSVVVYQLSPSVTISTVPF